MRSFNAVRPAGQHGRQLASFFVVSRPLDGLAAACELCLDFRVGPHAVASNHLVERELGAFDARDSEMYRARLAALDGMIGVSRAALYDAPADPLINQLYLATLGARDATVRQISRDLPEGTVLTPY
jgi:hypothetical protein